MKKNIFLFVIAIFFFGCKKDRDNAFDKSPDERLKETLAKYQEALLSSATGWKATIIPGNGASYHFYFRFNDQNRVFMYSDFDTATARNEKESSYRLKALQQPSLIFDTYSYLHLLADPDGSVNGGTDGAGLTSDFEFSLDSLYQDSITLTGRINNTRLTLIKASQEDLDEWQNGQWADGLLFLNVSKIQNYFRRLSLGGKEYELIIDPVSKSITFQWVAAGVLQTFTTTYYFSGQGMTLTDPLVNGNQTINGFTVTSWDATNSILHVKVNNVSGTVAGAIKPLKTDLSAPQDWWQAGVDQGTYWISDHGFHSNGVEDAFDITTLSRYYYLIYWPEYDTGNDLFAPIFVNAAGDGITLNYGTAPATPTFTADGKAIFTLLGDYGAYPATGPAALSKNQLYIPEGYYFVKTSESSYDMVSAVDAKTWISWTLAQ